MAFVEAIRNFFLNAQDRKCQTMVYDEERGWHICAVTEGLEVDHLIPESQLIFEGKNPNNTEGIVRCKKHHTGDGITHDDDSLRLAVYGEADWSRHPDMGQALEEYRKGDKEAFKKAAKKHQEAIQNGERFTNDDEGVVLFERNRVREMGTNYVVQTGKDKPSVRQKNGHRGHWTDIFFGKRRYTEDEE